jgi:hypothetical protein
MALLVLLYISILNRIDFSLLTRLSIVVITRVDIEKAI